MKNLESCATHFLTIKIFVVLGSNSVLYLLTTGFLNLAIRFHSLLQIQSFDLLHV